MSTQSLLAVLRQPLDRRVPRSFAHRSGAEPLLCQQDTEATAEGGLRRGLPVHPSCRRPLGPAAGRGHRDRLDNERGECLVTIDRSKGLWQGLEGLHEEARQEGRPG